MTATDRTIQELEKEIKKIEDGINDFCQLKEFRFKQNIAGAESPESPEFDDRDWEVKRNTVWSPKEGPACFRKEIKIPQKLEGISLSGNPLELHFLFPSGVEVFWNGKSLYHHKFWADMVATSLVLTEELVPNQSHFLTFKTPPGDGLGTFGAWFSIPKVEKYLLEIQTLAAQFRFAQTILKKNKDCSLLATLKKAGSLLKIEWLKKRAWPEILNNVKEIEEVLEPLRSLAKRYRVHLIGHSHIDMNWLWDYQDTKNICCRDFDTVERLMAEYPGLTFSQDQAHIYSIVEENCPEVFPACRKEWKKAGGKLPSMPGQKGI